MYERCKLLLDKHFLTDEMVERLPGKEKDAWRVSPLLFQPPTHQPTHLVDTVNCSSTHPPTQSTGGSGGCDQWFDRLSLFLIHPPTHPLTYHPPTHPLNQQEGLAGVISGSIASAITTPFDVIKTRCQTDASYKGAWDCAVKVFKKVRPPPTHPPAHLIYANLLLLHSHPPTHPPTHPYMRVPKGLFSGLVRALSPSILPPTHPPTHPYRRGPKVSSRVSSPALSTSVLLLLSSSWPMERCGNTSTTPRH